MDRYLKYVALAFLLLSVAEASAQMGVRTKYNLNTFSNWDILLDESINDDLDKIFPSTIEIGIDHWFRLKNHGIEFMPELAIGLNNKTTYFDRTLELDFSYFAFILNTQVYAFDLTGDCDCPTFSKQGSSLEKGFFLNIAPGLIYNSKQIENVFSLAIKPKEKNQVNLRIGVGVGYDIGISNLFTITPSLMYNIAPGIKFNNLYLNNPREELLTTGLNQIQFQLRFGFRPDYVKS